MSPFCVLAAVVLVIAVIAWALFRNTKTTPEITPHLEEIKPSEPVMEVEVQSKAEEISVALEDDLTRLEGIGPKVNQVLKKAGITTFALLATADTGKLRDALDAAGYRYMDPAGWIEQARLAAAGKFDELKELQSHLKGGRKKK
jgi:predicted flap endonuclease-1-like 5' DNA nuclease